MRGYGEEEKTKGGLRVIWGWLLFVLVLMAILLAGSHLIGQRILVHGSSMYPTLQEGDSLILDRLSYHLKAPSRFDVVVFPFRYQEGTRYIKRIIGLPGETVQIADGGIYVNGTLLQEPVRLDLPDNAGLAARPVTLGADEYFVLGDNRNDSSDSREPSIGNIKREEIEGKVLFRIWPLGRIGLVR